MALRQMLLTYGLPDLVNLEGIRPTQSFINSQGFSGIEGFTILSIKDVSNMIMNHNLIHDQILILGAVR